MLTAAAVCLRASSIKVRISINNSRGLGSSDPDLFTSSLPFYYLHPILVTAAILDQMLAMVGGELSGFCVRGSRGNCATGCCTIVGVMGSSPTGSVRCSAWQKFVASLSQIAPIVPVFVPTLPLLSDVLSITCVFKSFHERETTIDLILAGSDLFLDTYTLAKILWGPFCGRPLKVQ
jgi:hypothetical protein